MALLNPGYWQTTYWPSSYWQTGPQYWAEYGTALPPVPPEVPVVGVYPRPKPRKLRRQTVSPDVLSALEEYLEWKLG